MPRVEPIDPLTDPRWDAFVERHPLGWLSHTSAWARVLRAAFSQIELHYLALVGDGGEIEAGLPLCAVRSRLTGNRLVSLPFTTLCDPLVSSRGQWEALLAAAADFAAEGGFRYLECRTFRGGGYLGEDVAVDRSYVYHALELGATPEDTWKRFRPKSVRYCIQRAERSGLTLRRAGSIEEVERFYASYTATRAGLGLPPMPRAFFHAVWRELPDSCRDFLLALDGARVVAALMLLRFDDRVCYEAAGWDRAYERCYPNHFLIWECVKLAHEAGYAYFDFGRTAVDNEPLRGFKRRWGAEEHALTIGYYPADAGRAGARSGAALKAVNLLCRITPRVLLPALGEFCYRHRH